MSIIAWRISHLRGPGGTEAILQSPTYDPALLQEMQRARENEKRWFFAYLNIFYVLTTKHALLLIALSGGIGRQELLTQLIGVKPNIDQQEITTIIHVLAGFGMVIEVNNAFTVTPLGQEYLDFFVNSLGVVR